MSKLRLGARELTDMIDASIFELAERRILLELQERRTAFSHEAGRIRGRMGSHGMAFSSVAQDLLFEAIEVEVRTRAMLAWNILARILSSQRFHVDPLVNAQVKEILARCLDLGCDDLVEEHKRVSGLQGGRPVEPPWERMRSFALEKVGAEVDISLLGVRQAQDQGVQNQTVNIYQPIGIVQTGVGSSATLIQNLGEAERHRLVHALDEIELALGESGSVPAEQEVELREVIAEAREEIAKPKPNLIRLRSVLAGIATSVQTLGSAAAAYEVLKGAAALIGVILP